MRSASEYIENGWLLRTNALFLCHVVQYNPIQITHSFTSFDNPTISIDSLPLFRFILFRFVFKSNQIFASQVATRSSGAASMEMRARICDLTGKEPNRQARVITFSHKRIKKVQHVNLQSKRFFSENLDRKVKLRLSTKAIKTVNKMGGIDAAAKKFKVDLSKY